MKETESIRERNIQSDALGVRSPDLIPDFPAAILRDSWQVNSSFNVPFLPSCPVC